MSIFQSHGVTEALALIWVQRIYCMYMEAFDVGAS